MPLNETVLAAGAAVTPLQLYSAFNGTGDDGYGRAVQCPATGVTTVAQLLTSLGDGSTVLKTCDVAGRQGSGPWMGRDIFGT